MTDQAKSPDTAPTALHDTLPLDDADALRLENITLAKALVEARLNQAQMSYQTGIAAVTAQHAKWAVPFAAKHGLQIEDLDKYNFDIDNKIARKKADQPTPG